ncbi:alkaline phosphatase family protein [Pedobacter nyackensis]|uniref:Concanavalin A-like lectin/glucanases superfamily protein n=1 Tax=Pedobacter nyackensis TaxID=475255 RepID=A0A1W2AFJ1_9SPHI|nr:alkaline phosphatase family protein [Pedobacter nyackensis]SMC59252.1 Concanavalin A-like lectin/glucanases superfamily protein [Pedobacter nyackensis]
MKLNYKIFTILSAGLLSILIYSGCKKYDNPPPIFEELKSLSTEQRKVLIISIDGLTGAELQKVAPTNISALQKNSKYSYNTLKTASDAGGWASMLTGTGYSKHQISNDNFERTPDPNRVGHGDIVSYRNVLDYVTQYKAVKTAMVTSWSDLRKYMRNADFSPEVTTDLGVKDSTINILNTQIGLGAVLVNFREVETAGSNGGYLAGNSTYKDAIIKADEYVGNILAALKARKTFANEDWLVIVTSNHGGSSANPENGFTIVHNPAFKEFELKKTGFNPVLFNNKTGRATLLNDNGLYDAGETKSFTVQMDVKFNSPTPTGWSSFFSKSTNLSGGSITGWQWALYPSGKWVVTVGGTLNGGAGKDERSSTTTPGTVWHTLTMTVEYVNATTRNLTMYMDGNLENSINISGKKSLSTTEGVRIGHRAGDSDTPTSFYGANLAYFNTALSEAVIKSNLGLKDITKHTNYTNLTGFWPMDEGTEGTFFNEAPGGYNMSLSGVYSWGNLASVYPPGTAQEPITSLFSIPSTVSDVSALTLYWLKIPILADFGFDGKTYLKNFELEFLKN